MIPPVPEKTFPVTVTNTDKKMLIDYFDGEEFAFPPGKSVTVPNNVARHIFGYGEKDKKPNVVRLGWTKLSTDFPEAMARLAKFHFDPPESPPLNVPVGGGARTPLNSPKGDEGGKLSLAV